KRRIRMMSGHRQVSGKESLVARQSVDPRQHPLDRRWLVYAKARMDIASDCAGVLQHIKTAIFNDRSHAEVIESSGVKQSRSVSARSKMLRKRITWNGVRLRLRIELRVTRTEDGVEAL